MAAGAKSGFEAATQGAVDKLPLPEWAEAALGIELAESDIPTIQGGSRIRIRRFLTLQAKKHADAAEDLSRHLGASQAAFIQRVRRYRRTREELQQQWNRLGVGVAPSEWHQVADGRAKAETPSPAAIARTDSNHVYSMVLEKARTALVSSLDDVPAIRWSGAENHGADSRAKAAVSLAKSCKRAYQDQARRYEGKGPRRCDLQRAQSAAVKAALRLIDDRSALDPRHPPDARRAMDEHWWRRRTRARCRQATETAWRRGIWNGYLPASVYDCVSPDAMEESRDQDIATANWRARHAAKGADANGVTVTTLELAKTDPDKAQYAELIAAARGMGILAEAAGLEASLVTITAPSCHHMLTTSCGRRRPNPAWNGATPRQTMDAIQHRLALLRRRMHEHGLLVHYIRAAEPQADGTPHLHLVAWAHPAHWPKLRALLKRYFLDTWYPNEPGASAHRLDIRKIYGGTEGAVAYVAAAVAYMSPGAPEKARREPARKSPGHYRAWARAWGIRLIQCSGALQKSIWRRLRPADQPGDGSVRWAKIQQAARSGDVATYLRHLYRCKNPLLLPPRAPRAIYVAEQFVMNRYDEPCYRPAELYSAETGKYLPRELLWSVEETGTPLESPSCRDQDSWCEEPRGATPSTGLAYKPP